MTLKTPSLYRVKGTFADPKLVDFMSTMGRKDGDDYVMELYELTAQQVPGIVHHFFNAEVTIEPESRQESDR